MNTEALVEILKELLSEYFAPVGTISWIQFFLDLAPHFVTVTTIITSTIIQIRASKRESQTIIAQMEEQQKLERIRQEEARRTSLLEKQLENRQKIQEARFSAYNRLLQAVCSPSIEADPKSALISVQSKAIELLSFCPSSEPVYARIRELNSTIYYLLENDVDISKYQIESIRSQTEEIAKHLIQPGFFPSIGEDKSPSGLQ